MNDTIEATELNKVYDDAYELSDVFDDYCAEHDIAMTDFWTGMCEHWNIDEFGDEIAARGITTIQECINYFCD
jgi:hypothetical protein